MDLRPQSHEIIRTWLFGAVVRARAEHGVLPWHTAVISGWILDPDRKKISKSKGNAEVTPASLLDQFGAGRGAVLGRAADAPASTSPWTTGQMKIGRRLATKVLNASRFVLGLGGGHPRRGHRADRPRDAGPARLHSGRRPRAASSSTTTPVPWWRRSRFFWEFCDDYIELVKERAYGEGAPAASARAALAAALDAQLRLLAPFLPYVTEEVWSWWRDGLGAPGGLADRAGVAGGGCGGAGRRGGGAGPGAAGQVGAKPVDASRGRPGHGARGSRRRWSGSRWPRTT